MSEWLERSFHDAPVSVTPPLTLPEHRRDDGIRYVCGLDLGQLADYSALTILERHERSNGEHLNFLRHLQRWPLGTSYVDIVAGVSALVRRPPLPDRTTLAVDVTGVGAAPFDMLVRARLPAKLLGISIHGGDVVSRDYPRFSVPKRDLVGILTVCLQQQRLRIAPTLPEASTLLAELANFQVRVTASGHDQYASWREGSHDDTVLALACALWASEKALRPAGAF
jgi:hypothetical protein